MNQDASCVRLDEQNVTRCYLQDSRGLVGDNMMWWAEGGNAYTSDLRKAQLYSEADAQGQHNCRHSDVPWPAGYVAERTYLAVDMQHLGKPRAAIGECYAQKVGQWAGNDCLWLAAGGTSTDLREAVVVDEAATGFVLWPKAYIDALARPAVRATEVKLSDAIAGTAISIHKEKQVRHNRLRCSGCNRFMSEQQFWSGECLRCGTDSRP